MEGYTAMLLTASSKVFRVCFFSLKYTNAFATAIRAL